MKHDICIINPLQDPEWDKLIAYSENSSFFHTTAFAKTVCNTYKYKPVYITIRDQTRLRALLPIMQVDSIITGRRGVALPFADYCDPFVNDSLNKQAVVDEIINFGNQAGWKSFQCKAHTRYFKHILPSKTYYKHTLHLTPNEKELLQNCRESTKRNIKKAIKKNLLVQRYNSYEAVKEYYRLHCLTRKRHGIPPQPFLFFKNIFMHIISKNKGFVFLASVNGQNIAGSLFFHYKDKAYYKYGAFDKSFQSLRPFNLVMWEAIKWYANNRYKTMCFGRTETDNTGLLQFKTGWGTIQETIEYYTYSFPQKAFISNDGVPPTLTPLKNILSHLPVFLLRAAGSLLYKHIG